MAEADAAPAIATEAAKPAALTRRITGSLARRMIAIATIWISVLLIGGGFALDRVLTGAITRNFDSSLEYVLIAMIRSSEIGPDGEVRLMTPSDSGLKLPHVGWNDIVIAQDLPLFQGLKKERAFYFVHSYAICPLNPVHVAASCDYGGPFVAAVYRDNIFATQFHPEKSQKNGLTILENFAEWEGGPC